MPEKGEHKKRALEEFFQGPFFVLCPGPLSGPHVPGSLQFRINLFTTGLLDLFIVVN